jgi:hypothetical protein
VNSMSLGTASQIRNPCPRRPWNPTLRKVREGWGTPCVAYASEIKGRATRPFADDAVILAYVYSKKPVNAATVVLDA